MRLLVLTGWGWGGGGLQGYNFQYQAGNRSGSQISDPLRNGGFEIHCIRILSIVHWFHESFVGTRVWFNMFCVT